MTVIKSRVLRNGNNYILRALKVCFQYSGEYRDTECVKSGFVGIGERYIELNDFPEHIQVDVINVIFNALENQ